MNIDKTKALRYVSLIFAVLGIINMILGHYNHGIPDSEIDFYADVISYAASIIFGVTFEASSLKSLFKGKSGL